jgi:hypothetical protein
VTTRTVILSLRVHLGGNVRDWSGEHDANYDSNRDDLLYSHGIPHLDPRQFPLDLGTRRRILGGADVAKDVRRDERAEYRDDDDYD